MNDSLNEDKFGKMKEIWRMSALDGIRESFYSKELRSAETETRVNTAVRYNAEFLPVSEYRIREIISGGDPATHSECLISGYDKALEMIRRNYDRLSFDSESVLSIHRMLLSDVLGKKGVFRPSTEDLMKSLFNKYESAPLDDLQTIQKMTAEFMNISPFADGNKRISSLMKELMLLKNGYRAQIYVGLDQELPLTDSLLRSYRELDRRYPLVDNRKMKKRDRIFRIIETSDSPLTKKAICSCIPDVSLRTADVVLADLIEQNRIVKIGSFKDARYASA